MPDDRAGAPEWRNLAEAMWEAIARNWAQHSYDSHRCAFCGTPNVVHWDEHAGDCEARLLLARLETLRGVDPAEARERGPKFSKSELAQGSPVYREGWQDGYKAAEARERHPAEGQPGPWPGSVYNADGVAVYRAEARERGEG